MQYQLERIAQQTGCSFLINELLAKYTTWRVGGPADALFLPNTVEDCISVLNAVKEAAIPYYVIGSGSNILVSDKGFRGLIIKLSGLKSYCIKDNFVEAECGAMLPGVALETAKSNLTGFEFAAGIPGTVGGAVKMNAGAEGRAISDVFHTALVWTDGESKLYAPDKMGFSYRYSTFKDNQDVILKASFKLQPGNGDEIKQTIQQYLSKRKAKQPLEYPNAGSVFKNPPNEIAGKLIEAAGLKGKILGGAQVSPKHANFIINVNNASALDIKLLMDQVQQEVAHCTGICLQPEVELIGEF